MDVISATGARKDLYRLIDRVNEESVPVTITGRRTNAVLIGEDDWSAIRETLYLESIPGVVESIISAHEEPLSGAAEVLEW